MSNVQVAVRVRPMNDRERTFGSKCIVEMDGQATVLKHPTITEGPNAEKQFSFDYSYWSFDESNQKNFATQDKVFNDLGVSILDNAFEGFNCSIFAYGQTGSGKSYSMIGYGEDKGLIPKVCEEMFVRVQNNKEERLTYTVEVSFMEIYNETVKDLLNPKNNKKGGLKVRNHPKTGPYVEDLAKLAVGTYAEIESLMDEGGKSRTVAATNMNATSSRSHAVFTIVLTQTYEPDAKGFGGRQTVSKIHMVDLAGSERADSTGATGARLKEGANINKSLSTLGKVISALAKQAGGDAKAFVPYRDSVLTWLLKEALGGNSKTMMIAAISPADINYDETLSTLRYADSAKKIKNMAVVNEDPTNKLIRELQGEVENLRRQLQLATKGGNVAGLAEMLDADKDKQISDLTTMLSQNEKLIAEMNKSWEEKLKESQAIQEERKNALKDMGIAIQAVSRLPHLINLNEDPILSGALIYYLETGDTLVGTPTDESDRSQPEIQLYGLNICREHCVIEHREDGAVFITPLEGQTFVNGVRLSQTRRLQHGARIILGNNHIFRFSHPDEALKSSNGRESGAVPDEEAIDYNFALSERATVEVENSLGSNVLRFDMTTDEEKHLEQKIKEFNQQKEKEKENIQEQITKLTQEYEKNMLEFDALQQQESAPEAIAEITLRRDDVKQIYERQLHELETMKKSIAFTLRKQKEKFATFSFRIWNEKLDRQRLRERVLQTVVGIDQANAIIETLNNPNKRVHRTFELNLENTFPEVRDVEMDEFEANFGHYAKIKVGVKITNTQNGKHVVCSSAEFAERVALMSEIYQNQVEFGRDSAIDTDSENSPFYISEHDERLVGAAHCYLKDMLYFNKAHRTLPVLDLEGTAHGTLEIEFSRQPLQVATDESSTMHELGPSGATDNHAHEGDELLGQDLDFSIKLLRATDLPTNKFTDFQCRFSFRNHTPHKTEKGRVEGTQVVFDHEVHFSIFDVSEEFLYYLQQDALVVEIWGNALAEQPAGLGEKKPEQEDFVVLSTLSIEEKLESGEYKNVPVKQDPFSDPQVTFKLKRNQKLRRVHFSIAQPPGQTLLQIQGCESAQIGMFHRLGNSSEVQASEEEMRMMFPLKIVKVQKDQLIAEWDLSELEAQHPNLLSVIVPPLRSRRKLSRGKSKKEKDDEDPEDKISARVDFDLNISTFSQPVKVSTVICLKYFVGQGLQRTDSEKNIITQLGNSDESPLDGAHFHIKLKKSRKMQDAQRITVFIEEQQQLQTRLGTALVKERLRQELELHDRLEATGTSPTLHVNGSISPRNGSTSPRKEVSVLAHRDVLAQRIADIDRKSPARKKSDSVRRYKTLVKVEVEEIKGRLEAKKSGFLMKKSGSEWKKLWFVLTRAYLSYYNNENDLKPKGTMDLSSVKISALPQSQYMNTFALVSLGNVWVLQASTPEELQQWVEAIDPTASIKETLETREKEMREEIERLKRELEATNKAHQKAEEDRDVSRSSLTVLEDEFKANLREAEEKHARELKQKDVQIDRLNTELEQFADEVNRLKERAKDDSTRKANDARLEQLESSLKSTEDKLRDKDRELRDRDSTVDDLQREVKKLNDQLKSSEGKLKIELDDIQFDLKRTQDKLARQEDEVRRRDTTIEQLEDKVSRLERELDQKSQELVRKNAESERGNRSLTRENSYRSVTSSSNDGDLRQQLEEAQNTIDKLRAKVKEQNEAINREIISGSSRSRRGDDDIDMTSFSNMQKAAKFDDVVAQNKRYEEEVQQLKAEIKQVRREVKFPELTSKQVKADLTNLKDMASEYREREEDAKNKNRELQREIRTLKRDIEGLQRELNNVDRVKQENEKKMKRYQTIADEEAQRRIESERNEKKTREELDILKEQHVDLQTQVTQLKSEIRILNRALDDVKTR